MKRRNRALISGIGGFAGSFLAERLVGEGFEVFGFLAPAEGTGNIEHILPELILERFDLTDGAAVLGFVKGVKPEYVFHLAAVASVGQSIQKERETYNVNFSGSLDIFEALSSLSRSPRKIVLAGSAECYGKFRPIGKKLKETQPFNPITPYGISKAAVEYLARYYVRQHRLPITIARSFNHTGPRQSEQFAVPSFCRQIAEIEKGKNAPQMAVGDLSVKRDISDVRDIVKGYYLLARKGKPGEAYHLSSGKAVAIKSILHKLLGMSKTYIKVVVDKDRLRKADIPVLLGDHTKATRELGWRREYTLRKTLEDTLAFWRDRI